MNAYWKLNTHGDPLATITRFIQALWVAENLNALIVTPDGHGHMLEQPDQVSHVNPFYPLMKINIARFVQETLSQQPGKRIGIVLRACELRALNKLASNGAFSKENLVTICVDCLGTYPEDEVNWRAERLALSKTMTDEALRFAPQGGVAAYRYRPACQVCLSPGATDGDVNLCVLGLPVRTEMLVIVGAAEMNVDAISDGPADEASLVKHEKMLERITERHQRTRSAMIAALEESYPGDLDALIDQFATCDDCHACMDVCPICSHNYPRLADDGRFVRGDIINWLVSCAGCGMCEQNCARGLPLTAIFNRVRDQLSLEIN